MIKVSVNGALGRMGLTGAKQFSDSKTELIESLDINSNNDNTLNSNLYIMIYRNFYRIKPDVIVDFTNVKVF